MEGRNSETGSHSGVLGVGDCHFHLFACAQVSHISGWPIMSKLEQFGRVCWYEGMFASGDHGNWMGIFFLLRSLSVEENTSGGTDFEVTY